MSTEQLPDGLNIAVEMIGEYVESVVTCHRHPVTGELAPHAEIDRRHGAAAIDAQRVTLQHHAADLAQEIEDLRFAAEAAGRRIAELEAERDELRAELDHAEVWRGLAIQLDAHRMQALWHLRALISSADHADTALEFLAAPPLAGHEVVKERDELRARLAEIEAQEPVLWAPSIVYGPEARTLAGMGQSLTVWFDKPETSHPGRGHCQTPLYARPITARAVPDGWRLVHDLAQSLDELLDVHKANCNWPSHKTARSVMDAYEREYGKLDQVDKA